jgi:SAM-dependent methyltransferase
MPEVRDSFEVNRRHWDERAPAHAASPDYGIDRFVADATHLSDVVRFDLPRLGDIQGLRGVHLQCHIGTDTLSLARLGAQMTGLDFSPASIQEARLLAERAHASIEFVCAEVDAAPDVLPAGAFDLVYTGIGALCWLPSVAAWARVVAGLLRPGGRLFVREGHPMMWAIDERASADTLVVGYPYFETRDALVFDEPGTYVETDADLQHTVSHSWNHGLGEIISAVLDAGLEVTAFEEHDSLPWNPFPDGVMHRADDGEWRLADHPERLPLTYTLQARKPIRP